MTATINFDAQGEVRMMKGEMGYLSLIIILYFRSTDNNL